ncbi:sodium:proton antiporter [Anopheles sinensis]|uniref:Sodium:proton antiporter n=1 Tax=Anopheles sinensis TaxID=74873 RepID=A0A084WAT2_ANOSI|nr:sodium:proton antiporter [Anopheles sinensis]
MEPFITREKNPGPEREKSIKVKVRPVQLFTFDWPVVELVFKDSSRIRLLPGKQGPNLKFLLPYEEQFNAGG